MILTAAPAAYDPLAYNFPLPLMRRYYPLGVPVEIVTNSDEVLDLADRLWGRYPEAANRRPVVCRIAVEDHDAIVPPVPSLPVGQGHLLSIVHGPDNFAVCDLNAAFGFARLTRDTIANAPYFRYHFLEPAIYVMVEARALVPIHGSSVALNDRVVLLWGDSGAGKTSLAYFCARAGWTYLSDDASHIARNKPLHTVVGRPYSIRFREASRALFPELRAFPPECRPNGKLDIEIDTSDLGLRVAGQGQVSHIVRLNRTREVTRARLKPFSRIEAFRHFAAQICCGDEALRNEQKRHLLEFMDLPVLELTYCDLESAEAELRHLIEQQGSIET